MGYLNNDEATKSTIDQDGWLHTGDIVFFDKDGYLYVVDGLKEVIKFKGFQVYCCSIVFVCPAISKETLIFIFLFLVAFLFLCAK